MENTECPQCAEKTITTQQKLKAGKWANIYCPNCGARMCANPIVMALMYFILTWDILFFGYMAVRESSFTYTVLMIAGWLILELFIFFIPLNRMRPLKRNDN